MNTPRIKAVLSLEANHQVLTMEGWVRTRRESKTFSFLEINDGSCLQNLQVIIDQKVPDYAETVPLLTNRGKPARRRQISALSRRETECRTAGGSHNFIRVLSSGGISLAEKAAFFGIPARDCPSAAPHQYYQRCDPGPQCPEHGYSPIFPGTRLSLYSYAHHNRQRLRGRRRDVPGHHPSPGPDTENQRLN